MVKDKKLFDIIKVCHLLSNTYFLLDQTHMVFEFFLFFNICLLQENHRNWYMVYASDIKMCSLKALGSIL